MRKKLIFITIFFLIFFVGCNDNQINNNKHQSSNLEASTIGLIDSSSKASINNTTDSEKSTSNSDVNLLDENIGNTSGNISNEGLIVGQGDWVFYSDFKSGSLYKMKTDGSQKTKLDNDTGYLLNISSNYIYYCNQSDGDKLYKIKTDGSGKLKLSEDQISNLRILGDWAYYTVISASEDIIYKMSLKDGKAERVFGLDNYFSNVAVEDDWIYFAFTDSEATKLFKIKPDGTNKTLVFEYTDKRTNGFHSLCIKDQWIYYVSQWDDDQSKYRICRIKEDGTGKEFITFKKEIIRNINAYKETIYYITGTIDGSSINKVGIDGKNQIKLKDIKYSGNINIFADEIYGTYINFLDTNSKSITYKIKLDGTNYQQVSDVPYPQVVK